jgi:hypothetical protein
VPFPFTRGEKPDLKHDGTEVGTGEVDGRGVASGPRANDHLGVSMSR